MAVLQNASKTPDGVMLNGFLLSPVVDQCEGCDRVRDFEDEKFCSSYPNPASKWAGGRCNFATHAKIEVAAQAKVNPLKASKRAAKGR
ncbi:MAG: PxxKW family cysteine-rich protein [Desulfovibrio sp.]|nr:PxxKW family cysteine-rich protein [Desulfovibrio sp.]